MRVSVSLAALAAALAGDHLEMLGEIAEQGQAIPATAPAPIASRSADDALADRMADFIQNDDQRFQARSVNNIAKSLNVSEADVTRVANTGTRFTARHSSSGLGLLVSVND